ncbi:MAG: hypothetical protein K9N10_16840 [Deltaproteobacteria bacterium]|nr:hypothetical protein [Deltaproteobacteria bacterium]
MAAQRTIITISDEDKIWVENYSRSCGISMAEAFRRGLSCLKAAESQPTYERIVSQTRGIGGKWTGKDGLEYQEQIRNEWD